ncbi:hypothetical protein ACA910_010051 [Epithemia clementina (nom. ined.)]
MSNFFRGFFNIVQDHVQAGWHGGHQCQPNCNFDPAAPDEAPGISAMDGKEPMSVELYHALCQWFLGWGTIEGVFAHVFLVLTWNLMRHAHKLSDLQWITFDTLEIFFGHSKTDQLGNNAKYTRHIFANPCDPVLALSVYFGCCFNTVQTADSLLFPGNLQHDHFKEQLEHVLVQHCDDLLILGYQPGDIGTHSIQKGAMTYLSSLLGGPPPTATCTRGGWTMGQVRDIYMRYAAAGDKFVGCCLCPLSLLQAEFGIPAPTLVNW